MLPRPLRIPARWLLPALLFASPAHALLWTPSFVDMDLVVNASASDGVTVGRYSDADSDPESVSASGNAESVGGAVGSFPFARGTLATTEPDTLTFTFFSDWVASDTTGGGFVGYESDLSVDYWFTVPQAGVLEVSWDLQFSGQNAGYDDAFGAFATGESLDSGAFGGLPTQSLSSSWAVSAGELVMLELIAHPAFTGGGLPMFDTRVDATFTLTYVPVPEPGTLLLLAGGLAALARRRQTTPR